jgi:predicted anti-sigma-YlaC factor YlaD
MGKINCKKCHNELIPYLEGLLKGPELKEVELHLEECASCRGFAGYLSESFGVIGRSKFIENDPFFYTRLKAKLENQSVSGHEKISFTRILQPVLLTLVLMVAIIAGIGIGSIGRSSKTGDYAMENLDPWINEIHSEPIETFLMNN